MAARRVTCRSCDRAHRKTNPPLGLNDHAAAAAAAAEDEVFIGLHHQLCNSAAVDWAARAATGK